MGDKSCYGCKYFKRHYMVLTYRILPLECGHCSKCRNVRGNCNFPFEEGCAHWEKLIDSKEKSEQSLNGIVKRMAKEIHSIALVLNEEKDKN